MRSTQSEADGPVTRKGGTQYGGTKLPKIVPHKQVCIRSVVTVGNEATVNNLKFQTFFSFCSHQGWKNANKEDPDQTASEEAV